MTNAEIRKWYQREVARISELNAKWIKRGYSLESRARRAWKIRRNARLEARSMMEDPAEVEHLRERDRQLYGNADGPVFEQLVARHHGEGLTSGEGYEQIIRGSQTTNEEVDRKHRPKRP